MRVSAPLTEAPHAAMGSGHVERCCMWTRTVQGFADRVGHLGGGRRCLGEGGSGPKQHCVGWCSPLVERSWLR